MITTPITTPRSDHQQLVKGVVTSVQKIEPKFKKEEAMPPAEEPIPESPELAAVNAERVGSEEIIVKPMERDASNLFKIIKSFFLGGGSWLRSGRLKEAAPILKQRNEEKKSEGAKYDKGQMDIGE